VWLTVPYSSDSVHASVLSVSEEKYAEQFSVDARVEDLGSHGEYGWVVDGVRHGKPYVLKFFGYSKKQPDTNWILREIDNLNHLKGIDGAVQMEGTFNDTPEGRVPGKNTIGKVYPVIVMENLAGGTLLERISNMSTFSELDASAIFKSFITALQEIHYKRNMINCDLKIENLMFKYENADDYTVKIIDFGMAVNLRDRRIHCIKAPANGGRLQGTPDLLAPETIGTFKAYHQAYYSRGTDVWQAGCILYFLLAGHYPFQGPADKIKGIVFNCLFRRTPEDLRRSPAATDLLRKLLTKDMSMRLSTKEILEHGWITDPVKHASSKDYRAAFADHLNVHKKDVSGDASGDSVPAPPLKKHNAGAAEHI
jgi:serine/threonine protein kinase